MSDDATVPCATCGGPVDREQWHPASSERHDDGSLSVHVFCSEDCRDAWRDG